jgi:DNA-binding MarR family transcriptional regulator
LLKLGVLARLARGGVMSPGELAAAEHIQPQSLTRTLTSLERDRLIVRGSDEHDRRRATLAITAEGMSVLRADMHQRDVWLATALACLTPAERAVLRIAGELMQSVAGLSASE